MTEHAAQVLDAMRQRSAGTAPSDGRRKLGLVVEGGGMRGVISTAFLLALDRCGMRNAFDCIFAESAGALNAAYFAAGQAHASLALYLDAARRSRLIRPWRLRAMLDLDSVLARVRSGDHALDCEGLRQFRAGVHVTVTAAADGAPATLRLEGSDARIHAILKASSAIVPYYNRAVMVEGRGYVDGGIADPVPVLRAIEAGCTHVVVLLTRSAAYQARRLRLAERALTRLMLLRWDRRFRETFLVARPRLYYRSRAIALGHCGPPAGVRILTVAPPDTLARVNRFRNDADFLRDVAGQCAGHMMSLLQGAR